MSFALLAWALLFAADPFWIAKPPQQWTDAELVEILTASPWAQFAEGPGTASRPAPVLVFFATAAPMVEAEQERERRAKSKRPPGAKEITEEDLLVEEYRAWLTENRETQFVLAIRIPDTKAFSDDREVRRMEEETLLRIGRKKIKMTGHFPPSVADPYLRIAFPRDAVTNEKTIGFDLYLPGVPIPYRHAEFSMKDLMRNGRPEL